MRINQDGSILRTAEEERKLQSILSGKDLWEWKVRYEVASEELAKLQRIVNKVEEALRERDDEDG